MHEAIRVGSCAELLIAFRFLEAGRRPAWPLVPAHYDLLIDAGSHIYRVQVKQAREVDKNHWHCSLQRRNLPYANTSFDYLCVVANAMEIFVIPVEGLLRSNNPNELLATIHIGPGSRFRAFLNKFNLGTGAVPARPIAVIDPARRMWFTEAKRRRESRVAVRKRHTKLSMGEVMALKALPIRGLTSAEGLSLDEVAAQFGITAATVRNLLAGKRQDLKGG